MSVVLERADARRYWFFAKRLGAAVLDLIFPPRCAGCGRVGSLLCSACQAQMRAARPIPVYAPNLRAVSAAVFGGPWRHAIHALKYEGQRALAPALAAFLPPLPEGAQPDLIVPVPLFPGREKWRGYNQSALLAEALGARLGLDVCADALRRVRDTRSQVGLSRQERQRNVSDAFTARADRVAGRRVLLVDDVVTTGATLSACAASLYRAGAAEVWAATLACALPVTAA